MADDRKPKSLVELRWEQGLKHLRRETRNYWINSAFLAGEQWIRWSTQAGRIEKLEDDPTRPRITVNRMKGNLRILLGKLLKNQLAFDVTPTAGDDASVRGAALGEHFLEDRRREQNWEDHRAQELMATLKGGTAAICVDWDAGAGKRMGLTDKGRPYGEGDCKLTPLSIIEFVYEPGVKDAEHARWWIRSVADTPEAVKERYGLDDLPPGDATAAMSAFQSQVLTTGTEFGSPGRPMSNRTMVRTMYERPTADQPGRVVTVVNGQVVESAAWPFPTTGVWANRLNLVIFKDMPIDGQATGDCVLNDVVPLQVEYNVARTQLIEHRRKCGIARLWVPDFTFEESELSDNPGETIPYSPVAGAKAEWVMPPALPDWMVRQPMEIAAEMDDLMGVHAVSRGQSTPGAGAGVALSILAERDDTPLGVIAKNQAEGWGRTGALVLGLYAAKVVAPERRSVTVYPGAGKRPYAEHFDGSMLHDQTGVEVPLDVTMPRSRAAQQAWASSLLQMGAFGNPPDMRKFAKVADLPNKRDILEGLAPQADKAQRENEAMTRGEFVSPRDFDDDGVHIAEHNAFRLSERYEQMPEANQLIVDLHVQAHETLAAEKYGRQVAKAAAGNPGLAAAPQAGVMPGSVVPPSMAELGPTSSAPGVAMGPDGGTPKSNLTLPGGPANNFGEAGSP